MNGLTFIDELETSSHIRKGGNGFSGNPIVGNGKGGQYYTAGQLGGSLIFQDEPEPVQHVQQVHRISPNSLASIQGMGGLAGMGSTRLDALPGEEEDQYRPPPPPPPKKEPPPEPTCLDMLSHIRKCPMCKYYYKRDNTPYVVAIVILLIVLAYLLRKVVTFKV
jgi:hypothetical protein